MAASDSQARQGQPGYVLLAVLGFAILFGGGEAVAPLQAMAVNVVGAACLGWLLARGGTFSGLGKRHLALIGATLAVPLLQLLPLPPAIWTALPGRAPEAESLALIGTPDAWKPLSVSPMRTLAAVLSLLAPLAVLLLAAQASERTVRLALVVVVGLGLVIAVLGSVQLASSGTVAMFYDVRDPFRLHATFSNRNSAGLYFDVALCALIALVAHERSWNRRTVLAAVVGLVLLVALVMTRSRSSMLLACIPFALALYQFGKVLARGFFGSARRASFFIVGLLALAAGGAALLANERVSRSLARFDDLGNSRPMVWADSLDAAKDFWPFGSGTGTYRSVFDIYETLENLLPGVTNRAHMDYLELALESGIVGLLVLLGWFVAVSLGALHRIRTGPWRRESAFALAVFVLFAFQSLVDYPLRSIALMAVAALAAALLFRRVPSREREIA